MQNQIVNKILIEANFPNEFQDKFPSHYGFNLEKFLKKYCSKAIFRVEADEEPLDIFFTKYAKDFEGKKYEEHNPYGDIFKKYGITENVNLIDIVYCQEEINIEGSEKKEPVNILIYNGEKILIDGNHRACMALYKKEKTIPALIINLDK